MIPGNRLLTPTVAAAALGMCSMMQGCFTGIESTPKITSKEVSRRQADVSAEEKFAQTLLPESFSKWQPGHRLLVADSRLGMLFEREPEVAEGTILEYCGFEPGISYTGDSIVMLEFTERQSARLLRYRLNHSPSELNMLERFTLPLTVDLEMIDKMKSQLVGHKYYVTTNLRVDPMVRPVASGKKFIEVKITDILPGNGIYPSVVEITDTDGVTSYLVMTNGTERGATRNFNDIFSFSNPRLRYPTVTDRAWDCIVNSTIIPGMTTEECRLAIGSPRDIRRWQNGSTFFERWIFDNGSYCEFADGILASFRL